ncbi:hypothetical protein [Kitasatospora sp. NPDC090091]|uniref:hypothetical protein n=1 Tax=Kitasatospora sp. NPDC090091 TaxID=3364081 RepID=UPI00381AA2B0
MNTSAPRYSPGDVVEETATSARLRVLAVGTEAYFVRRLGADAPEEPAEYAWVHAGCEVATRLVARGGVTGRA